MDLGIRDRVALVTGAGRGMGLEIALTLAGGGFWGGGGGGGWGGGAL